MQTTVVADLSPKTLENARRQYVELYGSALVMNTYLRIVLVLVLLLALGLVALNFRTAAAYARVKPLVVRIDAVGRTEAVRYDATDYQPEPPELRFFLIQFIVKHFSRIRSTVERDYPDSLHFLAPRLLDATIAANDATGGSGRGIEAFVRDKGASEVDVAVQNVSLSELSRTSDSDAEKGSDDRPLYFFRGKASVDFQRVTYVPGSRAEHGRQTYVAQIGFTILRPERVPNDFVPVNPLGFQVTSLHIDQAFEEPRR
jgi:hypothetical protein